MLVGFLYHGEHDVLQQHLKSTAAALALLNALSDGFNLKILKGAVQDMFSAANSFRVAPKEPGVHLEAGDKLEAYTTLVTKVCGTIDGMTKLHLHMLEFVMSNYSG